MTFPLKIRLTLTALLLLFGGGIGIRAQEAGAKAADKVTQKPDDKTVTAEKNAAKPAEKIALPFQIQLLETHVRFEETGDSRKEVHTIVKINNVLGVQEFSRLKFDYNRAWQQVEIPMVRVSHANGGTSEVLPSAVADAPNPAVEKYPAYQDVRVKSVRILGLEEGDTIEYRVITTTTKHPLAPDFWLEHTFDRSGQVLEEKYQVDLPGSLAPAELIVVKNQQMKSALVSRLSETSFGWTTKPKMNGLEVIRGSPVLPARDSKKVEIFVKPSTPGVSMQRKQGGAETRVVYSWRRLNSETSSAAETAQKPESTGIPEMADVELGLSSTWWALSHELYSALKEPGTAGKQVAELSLRLTSGAKTELEKAERIYDFVSQKISTVDLPLGATGFHPRPIDEILSSGYATAEDKFDLFQALATTANLSASAALIGPTKKIETVVVRPTAFDHLVICVVSLANTWLDPSLEVAPFRALPAAYRGKSALFLGPVEEIHDVRSLVWTTIPKDLPFAAFQRVGVDATLAEDGKLTAKVKYTLRGDNELLLREAFHQTVKEKWKDVAALLALSDGFRGVITNATVSDPMATKEPLTVEYELKQEKFVDWAKKPVRIPALLPQIGLPDGTERTAGQIVLGTPLDVETQAMMHLPEGTKVQAPAGTVVERDYATYSSKYGATADTLTAQRRIRFLRREVDGERAMDYRAFVQAVQNDQTQYFVVDRGVGVKSAGVQ